MNQILPYELKSYIILILTKKKNLLERLELMKIFLNNKDEYILNNIGKNITVYKNVIKYDLYKGLEKYIKIKNKIYTIDILAISGNIQKIEWWIDSGLYIYYSYRFLDNICLYKKYNVMEWLINKRKLDIKYKHGFMYVCYNLDTKGILWFIRLHHSGIIKEIYNKENKEMMIYAIRSLINGLEQDTIFFKRTIIYLIRNNMFVYNDEIIEKLLLFGDDNILEELMEKENKIKFENIIDIVYNTNNITLKKWIEESIIVK